VFIRELGLGATPEVGDRVEAGLDGMEVAGVVDYVSRDFLGVRTDDAMYRFITGFDGSIVLGHHIFSPVDRESTERAWQAWVDRAFD
jgi:hypothetical protein